MNAANLGGLVVAKKYALMHGETGASVGTFLGYDNDMACAGDWPMYGSMVNGRDEWTAFAGKSTRPDGAGEIA